MFKIPEYLRIVRPILKIQKEAMMNDSAVAGTSSGKRDNLNHIKQQRTDKW